MFRKERNIRDPAQFELPHWYPGLKSPVQHVHRRPPKAANLAGVDWSKDSSRGAGVGVEVQVSVRSDMLAVDILHLSAELLAGRIDVGVIIVPDDILSRYLTDRTPNFRTAVRYIDARASDLPLRVLAFRHNATGPALEKMRTNLGSIPKRR